MKTTVGRCDSPTPFTSSSPNSQTLPGAPVNVVASLQCTSAYPIIAFPSPVPTYTEARWLDLHINISYQNPHLNPPSLSINTPFLFLTHTPHTQRPLPLPLLHPVTASARRDARRQEYRTDA
ncbi:hypothetical protein K1719_034907 [Acacia pycnantha]|nr:hypothetical protein K1719_034907 [Acacia pycnantha]